MIRERSDVASPRELLGLRPEAADAEVREAYRELESFLAPGKVPRRLQGWAARERAAAAHAMDALPAPAPKPAKPRSRGNDLPDFFEEDLRAEAPSPRPSRAANRQRAVSASPRRRKPTGLLSWRSAILILALGLVLAALLIGNPLLGGQSPVPDAAVPSVGQADDTVPLDQTRVAELTKLVQANPSDTEALFELGEMHFQAGKWQESIDWFTKLLAIDPSDTHARTDVGTSSFNLGRYEDARAAWEEVALRDPKDAQVHYNLGFLFLNGPTPDLERARAEWQKVVELAPDSAIAKTAKTHLDALR